MSHLHAPDTLLNRWQMLNRVANAAFAQGRLDEAIAGYRQAQQAADRLLTLDINPDDAIAASTISSLNLVDAHDRAGDAEQAAGELISIHLRLLKMSLDPDLTPDWRDAALAHSQRSQLELLHFFRTHDHPGIARLLQAATPPASTLN